MFRWFALSSLIALKVFSTQASAGPVCDDWYTNPQFHDYRLFEYADWSSDGPMREVFTCGATVEDVNRLSLLVPAIKSKSFAVTKLLLSKGADVNSNLQENQSYNLLKGAILNINHHPEDGWVDVAIAIARSKPSAEDLNSVLGSAIGAAPEQIPRLIESLLYSGADPNRIQDDERTPLGILANTYDWAPFYFTTYRGRQPTSDEKKQIRENFEREALALLRAGANPNLDGEILYNFYAHWSADQLKQLVVQYHADPNLKVERWGKTAFDYILTETDDRMCWDQWLEKVEILLRAGADANAPGPKYFRCEKLKDLLVRFGRK